MATPKEIPSKLNATASVTASAGNKLYIIALLKSTDLNVDGAGNVASCGPISLSSPIACTTYLAGAANTVAYYEQ